MSSFICIFLLQLVCAIGFLAVTLSQANKPLVIFTSRPRTEVENLPLVKIGSCSHLLTRYSITLLVGSHPCKTKVFTFHVRLLNRERLLSTWHKWIMLQLLFIYSFFYFLNILVFFTKNDGAKVSEAQKCFDKFPDTLGEPWLCRSF